MISQLKSILHQLELGIAELDALTAQFEPEQVLLFKLPEFSKEDEENGVGGIDVIVDEDAPVFMAINAFRQFHVDGEFDCSSKITRKYPGLIIMPKQAFTPVTQQIEVINHYKAQFKQIYAAAARHYRFDELHNHFPRLITLQVTRRIAYHHCDDTISRVAFYWHNNVITRKVTRQEILNKLYKKISLTEANIFLSPEQKAADIAQCSDYLHIIEQLPANSPLRIKRTPPIPVPAMNTTIISPIDERQRIDNDKISLPKFVFNRPSQMSYLSDYVADAPPVSNRAGKSQYLPVVAELGLEIKRE